LPVSITILLAQKPGKAQAVLPRHREIHKREVDPFAPHHVPHGRCAIDGGDSKALAREVGGKPVSQQLVVIDDDDVCHQYTFLDAILRGPPEDQTIQKAVNERKAEPTIVQFVYALAPPSLRMSRAEFAVTDGSNVASSG
jgi:hypothetical protein